MTVGAEVACPGCGAGGGVPVLGLRRLLSLGSGTPGGLVMGGVLLLLTLSGTSGPSLSLSSGTATFTIESQIYTTPASAFPSQGCSGTPALLRPGVTRCLVYRVHNTSTMPIVVRNITIDLDPSFPPPPSGCSADKLLLPGFTGSLRVPRNAVVESPGLPIRLQNTKTNQDNCQQKRLHFVFAGTATYAGTTTELHQGPTSGLPDTGADLTQRETAALLLAGLGLVVSGLALVLAAPRSRRRNEARP